MLALTLCYVPEKKLHVRSGRNKLGRHTKFAADPVNFELLCSPCPSSSNVLKITTSLNRRLDRAIRPNSLSNKLFRRFLTVYLSTKVEQPAVVERCAPTGTCCPSLTLTTCNRRAIARHHVQRIQFVTRQHSGCEVLRQRGNRKYGHASVRGAFSLFHSYQNPSFSSFSFCFVSQPQQLSDPNPRWI